eukprot:gene10022-10177_t
MADAVITFVVRAQLPADTRFLGIGLSDLGSMKGADIFLFTRARGSSGKWTLKDAYARGFETPVADKQQDLTLLGVQYSSDNTLTAAWQRYVTPCDRRDIPIPATTPLYVIWAHASTLGYHGSNRGKREMFFHRSVDDHRSVGDATKGDDSSWSGTSANAAAGGSLEAGKDTTGAEPQSENLQVLELVIPNTLKIPNNETSYFSHYFELPSDKKYHIVRYEALQGSNLLHHSILYSCDESSAANVTRLPSKDPFNEGESPSLCQQFYLMLKTGNVEVFERRTWVAPLDAGLPMGTANRRVVSIQLHYNNPQLLAGEIDQGSGVRVYYTSNLRKHDIGMMELTQQVLEIAPGKASVSASTTFCPAECTKRFNQPITLLNGIFHMHSLGKSAIVRKFRDGKELPLLDQLHSFDYDFSRARPLVNQILLPGDALTLQCTYDSTSRTNLTNWGPGALDEMCLYNILYYPAQDDMGYCTSLSLGAFSAAVCDNSIPPEVMQLVNNKGTTSQLLQLLLQFLSQRKLAMLPYASIQAASLPYKPICRQN